MRGGLIIVATLATAYMASHFFRSSNVTIGLDLMRDLSIGPEALGALTGAFFFGFAAMQIPCGFFFDRFGPRRTVTAMLVLATIGGIICGLQVVRVDGRPIDWATAIVRALGCFLSLAVVGLGFIWIAIDPDHQAWHDKIAGTVVVRAPKGTSLL